MWCQRASLLGSSRPNGFDAGRAIAAFIPLPSALPTLPRDAHEYARASRAALFNFSLTCRNQDLIGYGIFSAVAGGAALLLSKSVWALWAIACGAVASLVILPLIASTLPLIAGMTALHPCCHRIEGV